MGIFKRVKELEQKLDAICESENIILDKQPCYKVSKPKAEIGFKVKNGTDDGSK